jgi:hypothetical protein
MGLRLTCRLFILALNIFYPVVFRGGDGQNSVRTLESSSTLSGNPNFQIIMQETDVMARDAFLISSYRRDRYESPSNTRATTPAEPISSRATTPGINVNAETEKDKSDLAIQHENLSTYFKRLKSPPKDVQHHVTDNLSLHVYHHDDDEKHGEIVKKKWGKIRTAVNLSAALDPDRVLKRFQVGVSFHTTTITNDTTLTIEIY